MCGRFSTGSWVARQDALAMGINAIQFCASMLLYLILKALDW